MRTLPQPVRRLARRALARVSPVWWANFGVLSRVLARRLPPLSPPVWVVSLPRSGSSWVGGTLGAARDAMYLREPVTQTHMATGASRSVFEVRPPAVPHHYLAAARAAVAGLPAFPYEIVRRPAQWGLRARRGRRVVIKEVNPLALEWLTARWRAGDEAAAPRIVYLVRHPAAVAASFDRLGWNGPQLSGRFPERRLADLVPGRERFGGGFWAESGAFQALTTRLVRAALESYPAWRLVRYEDLCADPEGTFRDLFAFAGLTWDADTARQVAAESGRRGTAPPGPAAPARAADPYGTRRDSAAMGSAWRDLGPAALQAVREAYLSLAPSLYGPEDW